MADPLGVTPPDLRSTSEYLNDVSTRMKEVLSSLQAKLGGEGAVWGDDQLGDNYANGASGYLAQQHWVDGSIGAKTRLLDYYSKGLRTAANTLEQQDQA